MEMAKFENVRKMEKIAQERARKEQESFRHMRNHPGGT